MMTWHIMKTKHCVNSNTTESKSSFYFKHLLGKKTNEVLISKYINYNLGSQQELYLDGLSAVVVVKVKFRNNQ